MFYHQDFAYAEDDEEAKSSNSPLLGEREGERESERESMYKSNKQCLCGRERVRERREKVWEGVW